VVTAGAIVEALTRREMEHSPAEVICVVALAVPLAIRRSHPLAAIGAEAVVFLAAATLQFAHKFPPDTVYAFIGILAYSCASRLPRRLSLIGVVGLLVALQVGVGFNEFPNFELAFVTLGPWWAGRRVLQRRELVSTLEARTHELEDEEEAFAALSVRRERARIARELHDIVSHHLAVMVIQAGAGRLAVGDQAEHAAERLATIGDAGRQAMTEMAGLLDMLQADASGERITQLLERAQANGSKVNVVAVPADLQLPRALEQHAYRVIQEGLTSAPVLSRGAELRLLPGQRRGGCCGCSRPAAGSAA